MAIYSIVFEHSYYLIVRLIVIKKSDTSNRDALYYYVTVSHVLLREDADIQGVTVTLYIITGNGLVGQVSHPAAAIAARYETVQ